MTAKFLFATFLVSAFLMGCTSKPVEYRTPAGTGDVDSSTTESFESYKLPITRAGKKTTRVAYNFWSGEWPGPVVDVNSGHAGKTTIQAYTNLRDPQDSDNVSCTIKNGIYHPWSKKDPSSITYYTLSNAQEYKATKNTSITFYDRKGNDKKVRVPKEAMFTNVIYYGENLCGAILKIKKVSRPISVGCDYFAENKDLVKISNDEEFSEQWLYLTCEENTAEGKTLKAFVRDEDILKQPNIQRGCAAEFGEVQGADDCEK